MRTGTKIFPLPGVNGTATSTRDPSGYLLRLRKLRPPRDKSSHTATSSLNPLWRIQGRIRAFTLRRVREGLTLALVSVGSGFLLLFRNAALKIARRPPVLPFRPRRFLA